MRVPKSLLASLVAAFDARRDGAVTDEGWKYSPKLTP
jgi:hypothetical protein